MPFRAGELHRFATTFPRIAQAVQTISVQDTREPSGGHRVGSPYRLGPPPLDGHPACKRSYGLVWHRHI